MAATSREGREVEDLHALVVMTFVNLLSFQAREYKVGAARGLVFLPQVLGVQIMVDMLVQGVECKFLSKGEGAGLANVSAFFWSRGVLLASPDSSLLVPQGSGLLGMGKLVECK